MSPQAAEMLVQQIGPRIRSVLNSSMIQVGSDDVGELAQDGLALAARLLTSAEVRGKKVSAGNISHYTTKLLKQGRRSTGQSTTDVLHPATQLAGRSRLTSLDAPIGAEPENEEVACLHDILAAGSADPSQEAAKHLDWQPLVAALDNRTRAVLHCLVQGGELTSLVPKLKRSRSALQQDKTYLAGLVREHLGQNILREVQQLPLWAVNVATTRQRVACRLERQSA